MITFDRLGTYGRLGNQLWQIACTVALARKHNSSYGFPVWKYQPYFGLKDCFYAQLPMGTTYQEPSFTYSHIPYRPNLNLLGYFQSYKYFDFDAAHIRQLLTPNKATMPLGNIVGIHVRRTDYLKFASHHYNLPLAYYQQAIEKLQADKVMVFSDDIAWCRQHFPSHYYFSEGNEIEDLSRLTQCCALVLGNSSFSWWGAWLNPDLNRRIIAPGNWFGSALKTTHSTQDMLLPHWEVLYA